jgi:hypothetical protein
MWSMSASTGRSSLVGRFLSSPPSVRAAMRNSAVARSAAINEAARTPMRASSCCCASSKARSATNSETVKPIPASAAPALMCERARPSGRRPSPERTANPVNSVMPSSFPATRPTMIPMVMGESTARPRESPSMTTPAFARAKIGTTT